MKKYNITLNNISDVLKLRKIAKKYGLVGFVEQEKFRVKMTSVAGIILGLPLDHPTLILYTAVTDEALPFAERALQEAYGEGAELKPAYT